MKPVLEKIGLTKTTNYYSEKSSYEFHDKFRKL